MFDLTGKEKVVRMPILVSTPGRRNYCQFEIYLQASLSCGRSCAQRKNENGAWKTWSLVCVLIQSALRLAADYRMPARFLTPEQLLYRPLPHYDCRHHIIELVLAVFFVVCMGPSHTSEVLTFKRSQGQWSFLSTETERYDDVLSDDFASAELLDVRDEVTVFYELQLQNQQPHYDYRKLLQLLLVFLGRTSNYGTSFRALGHCINLAGCRQHYLQY